MTNYPCIECIVKGNCSKMCPEVWKHKIYNSILKTGNCPDCGGKDIYVHNITEVFWVVSCCICRSRFTFDFELKTLIINRSRFPKRDIGSSKGKVLSFTITTYYEFIKDMKRRG
jgi:hypothetical protein